MSASGPARSQGTSWFPRAILSDRQFWIPLIALAMGVAILFFVSQG